MAGAHVRDVRIVIGHANDAADHRRDTPRDAGRVGGVGGAFDGMIAQGLALLPFGPIVRSKSAKMREYSSVQLDGRTKPWSSTG